MSPAPNNSWAPSASFETLKSRAIIMGKIRNFFRQHEILEVETPLLAQSTVTDPYLESFTVESNQGCHFLQTSPEYAMKRLLAAGYGDIFQISKAFRAEEQGHLHNSEFSLLEWYRIDYDHHQLMQEADEFLQAILSCKPARKVSYQALFEQHCHFNPHNIALDELMLFAKKQNLSQNLEQACHTRADWLMLIISHHIEPKLGYDAPCIIYDYPLDQAALAKIENGVAQRFEVYINGIELANGFHELQDHDEQNARFEKDLTMRKTLGKKQLNKDQNFLAALKHGLPPCSGVALGIDRLLMVALNQTSIDAVQSFSFQRA